LLPKEHLFNSALDNYGSTVENFFPTQIILPPRPAKNLIVQPPFKLPIRPQPTDTSCGPTCLASVYEYFGQATDVADVVTEIGQLDGGGTLAVDLACHALHRGYQAAIVTYNLQLFDPTWFSDAGEMISVEVMISKLTEQFAIKRDRRGLDQSRFRAATSRYIEFVKLGGQIRMQPMGEDLITSTLEQKIPILCGLSATYLYHESRETAAGDGDDVAGEPTGHFVVLHGYDSTHNRVWIADPLQPNPIAATKSYTAPLSRVMSAVLLGIVTYDANLLMITPTRMSEKGTSSD
jgi:hypothetical protein